MSVAVEKARERSTERAVDRCGRLAAKLGKLVIEAKSFKAFPESAVRRKRLEEAIEQAEDVLGWER